MGSRLTFALGALNGAIGDYLARTENGLAFEMNLIHEGAPLALTKDALSAAHPDASSRICVLVHGLMNTEDVWRTSGLSTRMPHDYGTRLHDAYGFTPYYVRYNSGLPIPENGALFAKLLTDLVAAHPVPVTEILLVGYSMGGLVIRSACHVASLAKTRLSPDESPEELPWLALVRRAIYVGTPHRGAPLERAGRVLVKVLSIIPDPYTRVIADIANMRSDGIKDLGDADVAEVDRARRLPHFSVRSAHHPVPLLPQIDHLLIFGSLSEDARLAMWFGDVIVPVPSATFDAVSDREALAIPPDHVKYVPGLNHIGLPNNDRVWEHIDTYVKGTEREGSDH